MTSWPPTGWHRLATKRRSCRACATVLGANQDAVAQIRNGKTGTFGFLVGQVMKATGGKANPKLVNELLRRELDTVENFTAQHLIETHHLSKLYSRGVYALRDLSIQRREGRVRVPHRSERRRQVDVPASAAARKPAHRRRGDGRRPESRAADARTGAGVPAQRRVRVPGLQADSAQDRARECVDRAARARRAYFDPAAQDVPGAEMGWAAAPDERVSAGAVGRRAAAHRDRPRAGERSDADSGRRADRQPRSRSVARHHEPVPRGQRARHDRPRSRRTIAS